jgi:hypothetical protein
MTSSGKMNGYSGSIRAKATVDVFNPWTDWAPNQD